MTGQEGQGGRDWREGLKAGDPLKNDAAISPDNARAMRRMAVAATGGEAPRWAWPRPLALAMTIAATLGLGIVIGRQMPAPDAVAPKTPAVERRQIQFETPGGTRIFWTLSSDFDL